MKKNQNKKALVLFSGGLDSRLVVKLLQEQGLDVELFHFKLPSGCGCCNNLECNFNFSQIEGAKLNLIDCTKGENFQDYLEIIKHPKFSRGKQMNPCIDCKIFMFKKAKEYADKNNIAIIATGEVLGERPLSQTSKALKLIDGAIGYSPLRPLSAKLLKETSAEKQKLVDRKKFLDIQGRQRAVQLELARKFNIKYPQPAGGCLLCENIYSARLKDLLRNNKDKKISEAEFETLAEFRHFRSKESGKKIILGKNEIQNTSLINLNKRLSWNILIHPKDRPGPTAIFQDKKDLNLAKDLIRAYSSKDLEERKKYSSLLISS